MLLHWRPSVPAPTAPGCPTPFARCPPPPPRPALNRPLHVPEAIADVYSNEITVGGCAGRLAVKFTTECIACPASGVCDGSITVLAQPNFWRPNNRSHTFYECKQTKACLGHTETGDCLPGYDAARGSGGGGGGEGEGKVLW